MKKSHTLHDDYKNLKKYWNIDLIWVQLIRWTVVFGFQGFFYSAAQFLVILISLISSLHGVLCIFECVITMRSN